MQTNPQRQGPSHRPILGFFAQFSIGSRVLLGFLILLTFVPPAIDRQLPTLDMSYYLPLHSLMEIASIAIAVMIVGVNLHTSLEYRSIRSAVLCGAFMATAALDAFHLLSYEGLPSFLTPNSNEKAILFWLAARWLVALALLFLVVPLPRKTLRALSHSMAIWIALTGVFLFTWAVLYRPGWFPPTFEEGQGLTPFKVWAERLIVIVNALTLVLVLARREQLADYPKTPLAFAILTMAASEIHFTFYHQVSDFYALAGHVLKIISYGFLYNALVYQAFIRPQERVRQSETDLKATLAAIPDLVVDIDLNGVFRGAHTANPDTLYVPDLSFIGKQMEDVMPVEAVQAGRKAMAEALERKGVSDGHEYPLFKNGQNRWFEAHASIKRPIDPELPRFIFLIREITELKWRMADQQLSAVALHTREAIMIMDADRRIVRVNQSFIDVTGYQEKDVLGHTPDLLYSDRHDPLFYTRIDTALAEKGVWSGEIWSRRKSGELFVELAVFNAVCNEQGQPIYYIGSFNDITSYKEAQEQINQLAYYDPLTKLANRRLMTERVEDAMSETERHNQYAALLFIDLDYFKRLNDSLGHSIGDELLVQVAQRMSQASRSMDSLSRPGGDEFIALVKDLPADRDKAAEAVGQYADKLLTAIREPYKLKGRRYSLSASIGITLFRGHERSVDDLLASADLAMYQSKEHGRNQVRFFETEMQVKLIERSNRERDLQLALARNQFELHFQSKQDGAQVVKGYEVLLRWRHPTEGLLDPASFIGLAESSGLIVDIGSWVLRTACLFSRELGVDCQGRPMTLAVNISERQMAQDDFVELVQRIITETGADPRLLEFEITETLMHRDLVRTRQQMQALSRLGIRFALDDFGTGYSSLAYLQTLPLSILKIDRSFVSAMLTSDASRSIVWATVSMALALGLEVVAEGVESIDQFNALAELGCHYYQGFLFSKPLPWDALPHPSHDTPMSGTS